MIELERVTFHYSVQEEQSVPPAVHNISLRINEGQTVAVIGHNGSGKSTLTKLIAGILAPQSGAVLVDGLRTDTGGSDIWTIRQRVGVVFQNPDDQLIAGTVIDDIAFGPENLGLPRAEIAQRVAEALELLNLREYAQMSISKLSVNLKQRVAVAGILAMRPRYLVLDEPTSMISGQVARQLLTTVQQQARERGLTVIHVTHFMPEVIDFDRVIVMDAGQILLDGSPETIFAHAEQLRAVGLNIPLVTELGRRLATRGWPQIPEVVLRPEQLISAPLSSTTPSQTPTQPSPLNANTDASPAQMATTSEAKENRAETPLFTLKDICYTYQRQTPLAQKALQGLTLSIFANQLTALIGPTNAGKSTLLDILAGLIKPEAGAFLFKGIDTASASLKLERIREQVGVVFQSPELQIFEETVGKDVSFGPRQQKVPLAESRQRVQSSLEAVGLPYEDFRSRYTYALSGGQKRRVAIAGVLATQSDVIIFDEPMAGLDPRGRIELLQLLHALKARGTITIVYISNHLQDIAELADVIHVLEQGRLLLSGTPHEILAQAHRLQALDIALPEITQIALALQHTFPALRTTMLQPHELENALLEEWANMDHQEQHASAQSTGMSLDTLSFEGTYD